jgi:hypothetical protein
MSTTTDVGNSLMHDLLLVATDEEKFRAMLKELDAWQLKRAQEFFWDFLIEQSQGGTTKYCRSDIISAIEPISKYQQRVRCKEPIGYCTVTLCIRTSPACACTRMMEVILSLRPLLARLVLERPELTSSGFDLHDHFLAEGPVQEPAQVETTGGDHTHSLIDDTSPFTKTPSDAVAEDEKYAKHKHLLWAMIETDGLDHVILMTTDGTVLQYASSNERDITKIAEVISSEIYAVIEQGEATNFNPLLTVTKEFDKGVIAIRSLGGGIYLVGASGTVLPGKIHSLIVRLGNHLKKELNSSE